MVERVRKVLHQDGASWNVTKLFSGCGDKLRLSPFYPINAAQFAPREQNKDKLIKPELTRLTNSGVLSVLSVSNQSVLQHGAGHINGFFFFSSFLTALATTFSQALRVNSTSIVTECARNPCEEAGKGMFYWCLCWDCLSIIGLFVLVLFRWLLFKMTLSNTSCYISLHTPAHISP